MTQSVWAPLARSVRLRTGDGEFALSHDANGWWHFADLAHGSEYGFLLDDDPTVLPDPRSRRQPHGVHGPSGIFDPGEHEWSDSGWTGRQLAGHLIYELHVGTFTPEGTLDSAVERLSHLVSIGVGFVEVLPVNAFNGDHNWGYDGVLWYAVHEAYGGPAAYQRFVDACHQLGLAVIQDVVYNHLGPSGNYLPRFGPYLHDASSTTWGAAVNLDEPEVRRFIVENALMWMRDYHVDGLRLDAVHALVDETRPHILQEIAEEVDALSAHLGRPLTLIAESDRLTLAAPFTPMLFMGEEWGASTPWQFFTSHPEPELGRATAEGRIAEFARMGWDASVVPDPQDADTFLRSKLNWGEMNDGDHARLLALYRELAALRRRVPELTDPCFARLAAEYDDKQRWFRLSRGTLAILVNFGETTLTLPCVPHSSVLLQTDHRVSIGSGSANLPSHSAVILAIAD